MQISCIIELHVSCLSVREELYNKALTVKIFHYLLSSSPQKPTMEALVRGSATQEEIAISGPCQILPTDEVSLT